MIAFTRRTSTSDASSGAVTLVTSTVTGSAMQVRGNPQRYRDLGLTLSTMPTLLFTPTSYNLRAFTDEFVMPGDTVDWCGVTYTVKDVDPVAPDGVVILARIVVSA